MWWLGIYVTPFIELNWNWKLTIDNWQLTIEIVDVVSQDICHTFHWIEIEIKNWIEIWLKLKIEIVDVVAQHIWHTFHWIEIDNWQSKLWMWCLRIYVTHLSTHHTEIFLLKSYVTRSVEVWQSQRLYFHNIETKLPKLTLLAPQSSAHRRGAFRDF